jgi:hypothetical protein
MEGVENWEEESVFVEGLGAFEAIGLSVLAGAVSLEICSSARSTERRSRWTWRKVDLRRSAEIAVWS